MLEKKIKRIKIDEHHLIPAVLQEGPRAKVASLIGRRKLSPDSWRVLGVRTRVYCALPNRLLAPSCV
jgi:hypothetical protein